MVINTRLSSEEMKNALFEIKRTSMPFVGIGGYIVRESHKDSGIIALFELKDPKRTFTTFVDGGKVYMNKSAFPIITAAMLAQGICFKVEEDNIPNDIRERIRRHLEEN